MQERITARMTVAAVLAEYPAAFTVFRQHGCPDMRRGVFSVMYRLMSVRAAAWIHRIPLDGLLRELDAVTEASV